MPDEPSASGTAKATLLHIRRNRLPFVITLPMDPCKALPLLPIEHVIRCQHQKHVGRRTASQYILPLLPQVGKILQLREVGANQPRPRGHSSWNIGPIGAAEAVSNRHRASSHARRNEAVFSPGCTPRTKVQSIEHVVRADNFGKNSMEKILLHAEALHIPPGATDDKPCRVSNLRCAPSRSLPINRSSSGTSEVDKNVEVPG